MIFVQHRLEGFVLCVVLHAACRRLGLGAHHWGIGPDRERNPWQVFHI